MVLRTARLTDDADYDSGETSGNVPRKRSSSGNLDSHNGLRTRCVPLSLPANMTKLRKQSQTTSIQRKETATTQKTTPSWSSYKLIFAIKFDYATYFSYVSRVRGDDKTYVRLKLQSTLDENNYWENKSV
ncbi:unnamed protein product [Protopolystoma xenopodis]|uniref:Uncharacterized protein n=1 Tax=Protopolystoma xenopodis TaxID=117903 RepID=A0A448WZ86_9PLAT|nr:unnamed protein product [Protopolystoma xenopodis]